MNDGGTAFFFGGPSNVEDGGLTACDPIGTLGMEGTCDGTGPWAAGAEPPPTPWPDDDTGLGAAGAELPLMF